MLEVVLEFNLTSEHEVGVAMSENAIIYKDKFVRVTLV